MIGTFSRSMFIFFKFLKYWGIFYHTVNPEFAFSLFKLMNKATVAISWQKVIIEQQQASRRDRMTQN